MDPADLWSVNSSSSSDLDPVSPPPRCGWWRPGPEGSVFHLGHILLVLGLMGGSGLYGLLYLYFLLTLGFLCQCVWAWSDPCSSDPFLWSLALWGVSLAQLVLASHRLRSVSFSPDFQQLFATLFQRLGVSLDHYSRIVDCCDAQVQVLERDHCFAVEGKTPIDKLSVLISGRVRVTVNGEFLHFIHPFQFLDSPEWDSLRPSEEGVFQVTLRAENACRYVAWRRKKLYLLFAKHRYIAKIFALVVRNDIADKLYSLNDKAFDAAGHRYDLRLPSYCHMPGSELEKEDGMLQVPVQGGRTGRTGRSPTPTEETPPAGEAAP